MVVGEQRATPFTWVTRIVVYVVLGFAAFLMVFPFLYMFFTSLKTTQDVFHSPPRLLPYSARTIERDGQQLPVYRLTVDGVEREMVIDEEADTKQFGFFTTADQINAEEPELSSGLLQIAMDEAVETGETQEIGGEEFDVYEVPVNGETQTLLMAYRRGLKRFVDINDASIETYAVERTAPLDEEVDFQTENYNAVLQLKNLDRSLINTAVVTILVTLGQVVTSLLGGYAFSRIKFRGRNGLFMVYLGTIMIPFVVLIIPLYQLMVIIGWQNRLAALILPWIFTAYGTFLMRQFFITIPKDLEEAAFLDGLGRFGILWRIFVPLSAPAIATQTIITFLYAWNSFVWPLVIIGEGNTANHVVTLSLIQLRNAAASEPNLVLTGAAVAILPPLIVFIIAQRYFIEGIANTGLK
jgi:ABC-type glycerol-3-phosphate transport system permease component